MATTIYHNPRCSKSRATLALLKERDIEPTIIEYLKTPPTSEELSRILVKLGKTPPEIMRTGESDYKEAAERVAELSYAEQVDWLVQHPKVIERPIVVTGKGARIGRPPENVLDIL